MIIIVAACTPQMGEKQQQTNKKTRSYRDPVKTTQGYNYLLACMRSVLVLRRQFAFVLQPGLFYASPSSAAQSIIRPSGLSLLRETERWAYPIC